MGFAITRSLLLFGSLMAVGGLADQVVRLDRPSGSPTFEPYFNPKSVTADIGEIIHFEGFFGPLSAVLSPKVGYNAHICRHFTHFCGLSRSPIILGHVYITKVVML